VQGGAGVQEEHKAPQQAGLGRQPGLCLKDFSQPCRRKVLHEEGQPVSHEGPKLRVAIRHKVSEFLRTNLKN
jgi:hypothetical protein